MVGLKNSPVVYQSLFSKRMIDTKASILDYRLHQIDLFLYMRSWYICWKSNL